MRQLHLALQLSQFNRRPLRHFLPMQREKRMSED